MFSAVLATALMGQFVGNDVPPGYEKLALAASAKATADAAKARAAIKPETPEAKKARLKAEAKATRAGELARRRRVAKAKADAATSKAAREKAMRDVIRQSDIDSGGQEIRNRSLLQKDAIRQRSQR